RPGPRSAPAKPNCLSGSFFAAFERCQPPPVLLVRPAVRHDRPGRSGNLLAQPGTALYALRLFLIQAGGFLGRATPLGQAGDHHLVLVGPLTDGDLKARSDFLGSFGATAVDLHLAAVD